MTPAFNSLFKGRSPLKLKSILPAALIAGAVAFGAAPAKALTGSLAFSNGNGDFFNQVSLLDGDTFSVLFNPPPPDGETFVTTSIGLFTPDFPGTPPNYLVDVSSPTADFTIRDGSQVGTSAIYTLDADTVFEFDNGVDIGITEDTAFLVLLGANGVSVDLLQERPPNVQSFVTGLSSGAVTVTDGAFTFNDTPNPDGGGSYSANIDVAQKVPGPLPILGAGVAFGYSRKVRRRIKLSQTV